jgi:hypothetical protein
VADTAANYITEKPKGYPLGFFVFIIKSWKR